MSAWAKGLLLGMTLQLSVGPVFFALLHKSIREGFREAMAMVWGVSLADAFYIALSFTAVSRLLAGGGWLERAVRLGGAGILVFFGLRHFRPAAGKTGLSGDWSGRNSFGYGLKLTLANPLSIVFWTGTLGAVVASGLVPQGWGTFFYAFGCVSATVLFLGAAALFGSRIQHLFTERLTGFMDRTVGVILVLFAARLLFK